MRARRADEAQRDELTAEWRERGAEEGREFAILTEILHHGAFDVSIADHRQVKQLKTRNNLPDNMTTLELALTMLGEATSTALHQARDSQGFVELQRDAGEAGEITGATPPADRGAHRPAGGERPERQTTHGQGGTAASLRERWPGGVTIPSASGGRSWAW